MAAPVIQLHDVTFAYNGTPVLRDVNLEIAENEAVCIVGPNGGGKSTLLKLILGFLEPTKGTVKIFGQPPKAVRNQLGYLPQHLEADPMFPMTVLDVVLMGRLKGAPGLFYSRKDKEAARRALDEVGLLEVQNRHFAKLSGGQRQRVLIARAVACEPRILLLDEPTAMVDVAVEERLLDKLQSLHRQMTLLTVSHDLGFVSRLVDTVICVNQRVDIHPTSEITGEKINAIYGADLRMIRHDHRCAEEGHGLSHG